MSSHLHSFRVAGFASLADVTLTPGRLTVLIGANGSGKSNVLRALEMLARMRTASLQDFVSRKNPGATALLHYGPKRTQAMELELEFSQDDRRNRYAARLGFAVGDRLMYLDESVAYQPSPDADWRTESLGAGHWESTLRDVKASSATARTVDFWLSRLTFFHFHDTSAESALRNPGRAEEDRFLHSEGRNLAAYLDRFARSTDEPGQKAWRRINQLIHRVAPAVKELRPERMDNGMVRLDWLDDRDYQFGAHHLSDGTLRAIALITALAQPTEQLPWFMTIDEPELGLHPAAITLLAELARSVSRHTQVLFATQSTAFLDQFEPDEVVVVERVDGTTQLRRLDPVALDGWLEDYSLSEIVDKGVDRRLP